MDMIEEMIDKTYLHVIRHMIDKTKDNYFLGQMEGDKKRQMAITMYVGVGGL